MPKKRLSAMGLVPFACTTVPPMAPPLRAASITGFRMAAVGNRDNQFIQECRGHLRHLSIPNFLSLRKIGKAAFSPQTSQRNGKGHASAGMSSPISPTMRFKSFWPARGGVSAYAASFVFQAHRISSLALAVPWASALFTRPPARACERRR